jgi:hypothetical protein
MHFCVLVRAARNALYLILSQAGTFHRWLYRGNDARATAVKRCSLAQTASDTFMSLRIDGPDEG